MKLHCCCVVVVIVVVVVVVIVYSVQQSEMNLRESIKKLEDVVAHLQEELLKTRRLSAQSQESLKQELEEERRGWCDEKDVLSKRLEECQARQQSLNQKLQDSRKESKRVREDGERSGLARQESDIHTYLFTVTASLQETGERAEARS